MTLRRSIFLQSQRPVLYVGLLLASLALLGLRLGQTLPINAWSLSYARLAMKGKPALDVLPEAPERHERASIWLAEEAVSSGDPARALDLLDATDRESAQDALSSSVRADALLAQGYFPEAVEGWVQAGDYQSLIQAATVAQSQGRLDDAELAYRGAWSLSPADGTLALANFLWQGRGDPAEAERVLRTSLSSYDAGNLNRLRSLGLVLQAQSKWEEAIVVYQEALNQNSDDLYTLTLLGHAYLDGKDNFELARSIFDYMISVAPREGDGYFAMGQLMAKQGKSEEAEEWFVEALVRNPENPWWWVVRANTQRNADNISTSLGIYHEAVRRFPSFAPSYFELAWAYKLNGQPKEAIRAIEQALARQGMSNPWYFVRAGEVYEWAGEKAQARLAYLSALEVDTGNVYAHWAAQQSLHRLDSAAE